MKKNLMIKKEIAMEYPETREEIFADNIINILKTSLQTEYGRRKFQRRFHAKSLGLLEAKFKIEDNLPENLKVGLFKTPKTYMAWIRFSNAASGIGDDHKKGARGMSVKVLNAGEIPFELDAFGNTQDFLLTNNKILFPGTVFMQRYAIRTLFLSWINFIYVFIYIIISFKLKSALSFWKGQIKIPNMLECFYFSATPYLFGEGQAVKWRARPVKPVTSPMPVNPKVDFLRRQLSDDLSIGEFDFELSVQLQQDAYKQPVEDCSVEWKTPFIKVATITILKQDFNTAERKKLEDEIVFSPWHAIPQHRPMGGINRMRRKIYRQLAQFRKIHNKKM